jgi:nucleoside-diphosphate-sugar epimerase
LIVPPQLLLTGASGMVGRELLRTLLGAQPKRRVAVLLRNPGSFRDHEISSNVEVLQGDLRLPQLGLDDAQIGKLQSSLVEVIHCAAETRFSLPLDEIRATNVAGTRNLLGLVGCCRRLAKFAYVSTLYVAGRREGRISEEAIAPAPAFTNSYQQSKFEAEEIILRYAEQMPVAIFRLSSIIGNSQTGCVEQFNYVHHLLRLFPRNVLPMIPGKPNAPIDLVPSNWVIPALGLLFDKHFAPGRIFHLCAGIENSLTLREMIELTTEIFDSHPQAKRWKPISVPQMVSLAQYEQFVNEQFRGSDRLLKELLRVLDFFLPQLAFCQEFENHRTANLLAGSGLAFPPIRDAYVNVVKYCLDTNWGQNPRVFSSSGM